MKIIMLIGIFLAGFANKLIGQGPCACCTQPVESSVVSKPYEAGVLSATCNVLVIKWKGNFNQAYEVTGTYTKPGSVGVLPLHPPVSVTADNDYDCTATIPVEPGSLVSWNVRAKQQIDDRTYYSYTLRAMQDYPIPDCLALNETDSRATGASFSTELRLMNEKMALYPNPVGATINVNLSNSYTGSLRIIISDATGRSIRNSNFEKRAGSFQAGINVYNLKSGTYFLSVINDKGQTQTSRFIKR